MPGYVQGSLRRHRIQADRLRARHGGAGLAVVRPQLAALLLIGAILFVSLFGDCKLPLKRQLRIVPREPSA
jgi:hypothetical protein